MTHQELIAALENWPPGEFEGVVRCPTNPFPLGSEWGDNIDAHYSKRIKRLRARALNSKDET